MLLRIMIERTALYVLTYLLAIVLTTTPRGSVVDVLVLSMVSIKSVTIGLHSWLPDAMEGPTSVSAVIHAATLVVAGALLVCKVAIQL